MTTTKKAIGLNVAGVSKIQTAIENYKAAVKKSINIGATDANIAKAVKGNEQTVIKNKMNEIDSSMESLLSTLDKYKNYLDNLSSTYSKTYGDGGTGTSKNA